MSITETQRLINKRSNLLDALKAVNDELELLSRLPEDQFELGTILKITYKDYVGIAIKTSNDGWSIRLTHEHHGKQFEIILTGLKDGIGDITGPALSVELLTAEPYWSAPPAG